MPQVSGIFGPYPVTVVLDGSGNGTVAFQALGDNIRITNGYVSVSTQVNQAQCTAYKGQIGPQWALSSTNSGSTGAPLKGPLDLFDGEILYVRWTGGDAGATATLTVSGKTIPFSEVSGTTLEWEDPICAGDGSLIYPSIKSPDFVSGSGGTGWSINRDGTFELNSGTIRGQLDVVSPSGSFIRTFVDSNVAQLLLQPPDDPPTVFGAANIFCQDTTDGPQLVLEGPSVESPSFQGAGTIYIGADQTLSQTAVILSAQEVVIGDSGAGTTTDILSDAVRVQGHDIGRGFWSGISDSADSGANTVEFVVLTIASDTYKAGRLYEVKITGRTAPAAASTPQWQLRKTNATGTVVYNFGRVDCSAAQEFQVPPSGLFRVGGSDVTTVLVLTLNGGGTSVRHDATSGGRSVSVWDVGLGSTLSNVAELT